MKIDNYLKKRVYIFFISLVVILALIFGTYLYVNKNVKSGVFNIDHLSVNINNGKNTVNISANPLIFEQGVEKDTDNIIKIVNKSNLSTKFCVVVKQNDKYRDNLLTLDKIYYVVSKFEPELLSEVEDGKVYCGKINPNSAFFVDLKLWVSSEKITNIDQGKEVHLTFDVIEDK